MAKAYAIVSSCSGQIKVEGLQDYRPIGAMSFLGRYRIIDFPMSNLSNSGINRIQVYVSQNPRSLAEHLGNGVQYNINPKRGKLQILFNQDSKINDIYNTDVAAYSEYEDIIERMHQEYVIIVPSHMIYTEDYSKLLDQHVKSGADVTMLYHKVDNAKEACFGCNVLEFNRQGGVEMIQRNDGTENERNIFMETYIMKNELFLQLLREAREYSSVFTLTAIINAKKDVLDVRGVEHKGYFAAITDFKSFYNANLELLNYQKSAELFAADWPINTVTTDSAPVHYYKGSEIHSSMVANGCEIEGEIVGSVIGRGVTVQKGAFVKNCVIMGHCTIGEDVHIENQVVDKWAKILHTKNIIAPASNPGYIKRNDVI